MLPNHIITGISDNGKKVVLQAVHPLMDSAVTDIDLAELENRGYDSAVATLGKFMLAVLRLIHPDALTPYPSLLALPEDSPSPEKIALAQRLAYIATTEHSAAYIPAIDDLMKVEPGRRESNHPFMASWPGKRAMIVKVAAT
jgi:hypothetical protein